MELDPVLLSRLQFAWVIAWHILLPAFTVGLASYIAVLEGLHLATGREVYLRISMFWIRIFSVSFGMGVVSGIVMPFQFGTNWSRFSDATANVLSPLFAYEGLTAFFLEAAFLGVLLFGRKLVPRWAHFVAAADGGAAARCSRRSGSWRQQLDADAGRLRDRRRPLLPEGLARRSSSTRPFPIAWRTRSSRFYVTTGFVVVGVGAYLIRARTLRRGRHAMLSMTLWLLTVLVPLQIFLGDQHGLNTLEHQPAKLAAIEARWETAARVPLTLFAIPDEHAETNRFAIEVPLLGSLILTHDLERRGQGPQGFAGRPAPAGRDSVLRLPHHGRHRRC